MRRRIIYDLYHHSYCSIDSLRRCFRQTAQTAQSRSPADHSADAAAKTSPSADGWIRWSPQRRKAPERWRSFFLRWSVTAFRARPQRWFRRKFPRRSSRRRLLRWIRRLFSSLRWRQSRAGITWRRSGTRSIKQRPISFDW